MTFMDVLSQLFVGFGQTLNIFILTLVLALPLGLLVCFGSMSKWAVLKYITRVFVWMIRSTPLLLQIIIIYYGPGLLNVSNGGGFDKFTAVIVAFVINYATYFSEIYRGGIQSISYGQYEASYILGLTKRDAFTRVIFPQVYKRILPPMSNEIITLVKDTALARVIAVVEIIKVAENMMGLYALVYPLFLTALFYLAFNGLLTLLFNYLEGRNRKWA